jgi:hypothetical protein
METPTEIRLQSRVDRREAIQTLHESVYRDLDGGNLSDTDKKQIEGYRSEIEELDTEIAQLTSDVEAHRKALETSKAVRRAMIGAVDGVEAGDDGVVYRSMAAYARDFILSRETPVASKIATQFGDKSAVEAARSRLDLLHRTPANTLSSNVGGLQPPQHIDQIFQVINKSRPIVNQAQLAGLVRGTLTFPKVTQRPIVAAQASEKTEAGNQGLLAPMQTVAATTYLGGGDLSWQAINWSTPDALQLWFDLAAADYALKTEQDAAQSLQHSAFDSSISSPLGATPTFADLMTAIGAGYAKVFSVSGRTADTVYMAPDIFGYLLGLTSNAFTQFTSVSGSNIGPLNIVVSRGMDAGVAAVGDASGLLVAETPGAPVELRVVEPAIGGVEVGIIGAFASVVVDSGAFAMITTAS